MTRWLYSCAMWLVQPLLRRKLARRGLEEPGYLEEIEARFGHYPNPVDPGPDGWVWIHAVSLGETRTAAVLVQRLREQRPGVRLLLTHGTATGRAEGRKLLREGDVQTWQPWDTPGAVQRFLAHFRPRIGILMETEIWPNLVAVCAQQGVPLVLANARMSQKSQRQAQRLAWLSRPAFGALTAVWAQTGADAERLAQLGAPVPQVFGNLKFDVQPNPELRATGRHWRTRFGRPVVLFASSREGEELLFLQALQALKAQALMNRPQVVMNSGADAVQWLIVPRHPQRFEEVATQVEAAGFTVSRRSRWSDGPALAGASEAGTIWLGDSLGEMALYYGLADVALLGGSFEPLGGQNLIEAAACGCPVLMGPHTFNFAEAADLAQRAGAARRVETLLQALEQAQALLNDPAAHDAMVQAATGFACAHGGAVDRTTQAVTALLEQ